MANPYLGENPYLTGMIDKAQGDVVRNYNMTAQPAYNSAMVNSGSFGNAGLQQLNENGQRNLQDTLGNISNQARGADYESQKQMYQWDQQFDRSLYNDAFGQNQQQFQNSIGLLGMLGGVNSQDITNTTNQQNTPLNYWQQFANQSNQFGNAGGATSTTGSGSPLIGALGGAQLGSAFSNFGNNSMGNSVYSPSTNSGGWGNSSSGLGSFFYGNGGSGD